ncbi:amino acid permease [Pseudalkalibacillus caeni]|uniref:Amino acid permease n=1 Tax=Exobacillus caeni TaxID=2574798 RepID=A0A5R9FAV4_9BACL|nr:amino acid permease [Pseudalkalibacillus caeni]TLS36755.1 amino acid permease [Pseudalkalibacillus caeni]
MRNEHPVKQTIKHKQAKKAKAGRGQKLHWWQLSLIGIGSVIGAGFFLGTGLSIERAGPSVLILYVIAGIIGIIVFSALAEMSVHDKESGSFRKYAKQAFGHSFGFMSGWMYWVSGILIMGSEITALALFTQFWFPNFPLWILMAVYAAAGFGINLLGVSNFGKIESLFAIVKISTLVAFVTFGGLLLFGVLPQETAVSDTTFTTWFPNGFMGSWTAMIFVLFSFGGIAIVGLMATELENREETPKAGGIMVILLTILYGISLFFVIKIVPWNMISEDESPFVTALSSFNIPYVSTLFNVILITAAFSTMVGALFSITKVLVSLANDGDAPKGLAVFNSRGVAIKSLAVNAIAVTVAIIVSYVLPNKVYEYLTTAAGIMLILNWAMILGSQIKNRPEYTIEKEKTHFIMIGYPYTSYLGIALIALTIIGAFFQGSERIGVLISFGMTLFIFIGYYVMKLFKEHRFKEDKLQEE